MLPSVQSLTVKPSYLVRETILDQRDPCPIIRSLCWGRCCVQPVFQCVGQETTDLNPIFVPRSNRSEVLLQPFGGKGCYAQNLRHEPTDLKCRAGASRHYCIDPHQRTARLLCRYSSVHCVCGEETVVLSSPRVRAACVPFS